MSTPIRITVWVNARERGRRNRNASAYTLCEVDVLFACIGCYYAISGEAVRHTARPRYVAPRFFVCVRKQRRPKFPRRQGQTKHSADSPNYEGARGTGTAKSRHLVVSNNHPHALGRFCAHALQPYEPHGTRNRHPWRSPLIHRPWPAWSAKHARLIVDYVSHVPCPLPTRMLHWRPLRPCSRCLLSKTMP